MSSRSREAILPLCSTCKTWPGALQSALEPPVQERCGPVGVGAEEGNKDDQGAGAACEERLRVGVVQPREGSRETL